jgi:hypothetical protein
VTDDVARRYFAIAVSKSEDPRDGFEQWITTESNYSDWPRVGVGDGVLVVAHNACKNPDNSDPCGDGDHTSVVNNTRALRPMLYAFRTADMSAGHNLIDNWKVYPYQIGGGSIFPVQHHGDTGGWTYALKPNDTLLDGYRFEKSFGTLPTLNSTTGIVFGGLSGYRESIHFHGGNLYLASGIKQADRFPNLFPERWDVRGLKLPIIEGSGNSWAIGLCPGTPGCLDFSFGTRAAGDGADDLWSYEMPSMAVNDNGDMAIIFGRVPVVVPSGKGQEARYTLYYDDSRGLQGSHVLHEGDTVLKDKFCSGGVQDPVATAENYWHIWYGGDGCDTQSHYQDYGTAVADPEGNFWFAHSFADSTLKTFRMVGGKVKP